MRTITPQIRYVYSVLILIISTHLLMAQDYTVEKLPLTIGGSITGIAAQGDYIYYGTGSSIGVYNIANPTDSPVTKINTKGTATKLFIYGDLLFALETVRGVEIIDISNPQSPSVLGFYEVTEPLFDITANDNYAFIPYTAGAFDEQTLVLDISNPASPALEVSSTDYTESNFLVSGNYGFGFTYYELTVFNVSDPNSFTAAATLAVDSYEDAVLSGNYIYVAESNGFTIIDISTPSSPSEAGALEITDFYPESITVTGNLAVIGGTDLDDVSGIIVIDISNKSNPQQQGSLSFESGEVFAMTALSTDVFVTFKYSDKLMQQIDISNPGNPVLGDALSGPSTVRDRSDLMVDSDKLYFKAGTSLWRADVSNRESAENFEQLSGINSNRFAVNQNDIYYYQDWKLTKADISDPANPQVAGQSAETNGTKMAVSGNYAFVFNSDMAMELVVYETSTNPFTEAAKVELSENGNIYDVFLAESSNTLYVGYENYANSQYEVILIDVSNPESPGILSRNTVEYRPETCWEEGNKAVFGGNTSNPTTYHIQLYDVTDKSAPVLLTEESGEGAVSNAALNGDMLVATISSKAVKFYNLVTSKIEKDNDNELQTEITIEQFNEILYSDVITDMFIECDASGCYLWIITGYYEIILQLDAPVINRYYGDIEVIKISSGDDKNLAMNIEPTIAASEGCTTSPSGTTQHEKDSELSITATPNADKGWNFVEWTGDASGSSPTTTITMDDHKNVTANFVNPEMTLTQISQPKSFCPDALAEQGRIHIQDLIITVNGDDDWLLTGIKFNAKGDGNDAQDIQKAYFNIAGNNLEATYSADDGQIEFTTEIEIPAGTSVTGTLEYEYNFSKTCPFDIDSAYDYYVDVRPDDITAQPKNFPNYEILGIAISEATYIGCVINTTKDFATGKIQPIIYDGRTTDNDTCEVCMGEYSENVYIGKAITLKSSFGNSFTQISAADPQQSVISISEDNVAVDGFTLKGSQQSGIGISQDVTSSVVIKDCRIKENTVGIYSNVWDTDLILIENEITNNTEDGFRGKSDLVIPLGLGKSFTVSDNGVNGLNTEGDIMVNGRGEFHADNNGQNGISGRDIILNALINTVDNNGQHAIIGETVGIGPGTVRNNGGSIAIFGEESATISGTEVSGNTGIGVSSNGDVYLGGTEVFETIVSRNGNHGIRAGADIMSDAQKGTLRVDNNKGMGLVAETGTVMLNYKKINIDNNMIGVYSRREVLVGPGTINNNKVEGIRSLEDVTIVGTEVNGNGQDGIFSHKKVEIRATQEYGAAVISNNGKSGVVGYQGVRTIGDGEFVCKGNSFVGVMTSDGELRLEAAKNTVSNNKRTGVMSWHGPVFVDNGVVDANGTSGVYGGGSYVQISNSVLDNNGFCGVEAESAQIRIIAGSGNSCTFDGNNAGGIKTKGNIIISGGGNVFVRYNQSHGIEADGLVRADATLFIKGNHGCGVLTKASLIANDFTSFANTSHGAKAARTDLNHGWIVRNEGYGLELTHDNSSNINNTVIRSNTLGGIHILNDGGITEKGGGNELLEDIPSTVTKSNIEANEGDGIRYESGSGLDVSNSNILNNDDIGINNENTETVINALNNWWGDASGPSGEGPGSGDDVSTNVNFDPAADVSVDMGLSAQADTVWVKADDIGVAYTYIFDYKDITSTVDVTIAADKQWLTGETSQTLDVEDTVGARIEIDYHIPGDAAEGDVCKVDVSITSQATASNTDNISFYLAVYEPQAALIAVTPENPKLAPEDWIAMDAMAYDQHGYEYDFEPEWTATGGGMNSNTFTAGTENGEFEITATDSKSGTSGKTTVTISDAALAAVFLFADTLYIEQNRQYMFISYGMDQHENLFSIDPTWKATGGTIDSTELLTDADGKTSSAAYYTSPTELATYMLTAEQSNFKDTTYLVVTEPNSVKDPRPAVNTVMELLQNVPNPFSMETNIDFILKRPGYVTLTVYDMNGQRTAMPANGFMDAGEHTIRLNAEDFSSGVYIYELSLNGSTLSKTMVVIK